MDLTRLEQILDRASSRRITVIGDLMLDEFVWGKVGRISPEAPVPVVEVTRESFYPGGAANDARNLREFVDYVAIIGLLGNDRSGQQLQELLAEQKIDFSNAVKDEPFRTIVTARIMARRRNASYEMEHKISPHHAGRTRHDAFSADRRATLYSNKGTTGF